jgi:Family of unknown function (DUF6519)
MSGDYSRRRFNKRMDFSTVLNQQGRVQLDSDWNELAEIMSRRTRVETVGTMGRAVVPSEGSRNLSAFQIAFAGNELMIGPGRIYVDGLLAENHGDPKELKFDTIFEEDKSSGAISYAKQPYLFDQPKISELLKAGVQYAAYLDVWQRQVTSLERPELVETAVGIDTTTRMQTVWQVKLIEDSAGCSDELSVALVKPSGGRLSTAAVGVSTKEELCSLPPTGGYRGRENRLYRVEIHVGGSEGKASFKWSRDNASLATSVSAISADGLTLTVGTVARDSVMRFQPNDWIEITDDHIEFASQPGLPGVNGPGGVMARIKQVFAETQKLELFASVTSGGLFPTGTLDVARHTRIRSWDQQGKITDTKGNLLVDLDASAMGTIPVPKKGTSIILEDGVQITFEAEALDEYHAADYWNFAARTADASVELLERAPPRGVHHHFCRLAQITFGTPVALEDCRIFWPPSFKADKGDSCSCTVCVSVDEFNKNKKNIQQAIEKLQETGGVLCLGPGIFELSEAIKLHTAQTSIHISGRGQSTVLLQPKEGPALDVTGVGITIEDLQVWTHASKVKVPAFAVVNVFDFAILRCWVVPDPRVKPEEAKPPNAPAISLSGWILNATIRDNSLVATHGITYKRALPDERGIANSISLNTASAAGAMVNALPKEGGGSLNLWVLNNKIAASFAGVLLDNLFTMGDTRISGNSVFLNPSTALKSAFYSGLHLGCFGAPSSQLEVDSNHVVVSAGEKIEREIIGVLVGSPRRDQQPEVTPAFGTAIRISANDCFISWTIGTANGIVVANQDAFDDIVIVANTICGAPPAKPNSDRRSQWLGLTVSSSSEMRNQRCTISDNIIDGSISTNDEKAYSGVNVSMSGDCIFSGNQVANNNLEINDDQSDVLIRANAIVATNNRIKGKSGVEKVSMQLEPSSVNELHVAVVLGNICSARVTVKGNSIGATPPLNITA